MKVLYISYDGLTDNLGRSQIVPYLLGLSVGHKITVISAEKENRYQSEGPALAIELHKAGIDWYPKMYRKNPPIFSTLFDLLGLYFLARKLCRHQNFQVTHCRSYIASLIGLRLKRKLGIPFLFDMRGFWADERVDGKVWDLKNWIYRRIFNFFKKKEREFLLEADHVISLTQTAKDEIHSWPGCSAIPIKVIPCCADLSTFDPSKVLQETRDEISRELNLSNSELIVTYLGSTGTWYLLDQMLSFFKQIQRQYPTAVFLFISTDPDAEIYQRASLLGIAPQSIRVRAARRSEVPVLLSLTHLGILFIKPAYSKKASSATKLGEMLGMGIPIVTNSKVGDMDRLFETYPVGVVAKRFSVSCYRNLIARVPALLALDPMEIRGVAKREFSLERAVDSYNEVYRSIERHQAQAESILNLSDELGLA